MKALHGIMIMALLGGLLAGCSDSADTSSSASSPAQVPQSAGPAIPADLVVATGSIEGELTAVLDAKASASVGDEVTLVGMIGGRPEPFVSSRAMLLLGDLSLPPCTDHCATPWDYCCEPQEAITAATMTVQVTGDDGKALPLGLKGESGLEPGMEVVVQGVVSQKAEGVFVVDASKIAPN